MDSKEPRFCVQELNQAPTCCKTFAETEVHKEPRHRSVLEFGQAKRDLMNDVLSRTTQSKPAVLVLHYTSTSKAYSWGPTKVRK